MNGNVIESWRRKATRLENENHLLMELVYQLLPTADKNEEIKTILLNFIKGKYND